MAGGDGRPPATDGNSPSLGQAEGTVRTLMSRFPAGVGVVTAFDTQGRPWGATCLSVCKITLSPPSVLVCLRDKSPILQALLSRSRFAVNMLHREASTTAEMFASADPDRFALTSCHIDPAAGGPHLTDASHTIADCAVADVIGVGDHAVVIGRVFYLSGDETTPTPLLYGLRRFAAWPGP